MKTQIIIFIVLISFIISCEKESNPVNVQTYANKVTITQIDYEEDTETTTVFKFGEKSKATPPDAYFFAGKNHVNLWGGEILYYHFSIFYGRFGNIIEFTTPDFDSNLSNITNTFYYNSTGLLSEIKRENKDFTKYKYNAENKVTEIIFEPWYEQDKYQFRTINFYYGSNGYIEKHIELFDDGRISTTYYTQDGNGFLTKTIEVDTNTYDNTLDTNTIEYFYNSIGKLEKRIEHWSDLIFINEFFYDSKGNIINEIYTDTGKLESITNFEYDNNGYVIQAKVLSESGVLIGKMLFKYE